MSTIAPTNDGELIRSLNSRITSLENSVTQRVGSFVLSDKNGSLMATGLDAEPVDLLAGGGISDDALKDLITSQQLDDALDGFVKLGPDGLIDSSLIPDINIGDIGTAIENAIAQAITGLEGGLSTLTTWAENIPLLGDLVHAITGITDGGLPDLTTWAEGVPILGDIVDWITGSTGGTGSTLQNWGTNLMSMLGQGVNTLVDDVESFDPLDAFKQLLSNVGINAGVLTSNTQVPPHLFGALGTSGSSTNELPDPGFDDSTAFAGDGVWSWSSQGRTKPGSAVATANGTVRRLVSVPIEVAPGKLVDLGTYAYWEGLTGTGDLIYLAAQAYDSTNTIIDDPDNRVLDRITAPVATNATGWTSLAATYQAPANTKWIRWVFEIQAAALTGQVYADDALLRKQQGLDASWLDNVENMTTLPTSVMAGIQGLVDIGSTFGHILDGLGSAFTSGGGVSGIAMPDLFGLAQQITTTAGTALDFGTLAKQILGIRTNKSIGVGVNKSSEGTVRLGDVADATGTLVTQTIAAGTSAGQFLRVSEDALKGVVEFIAAMSSGNTGVYTNVYRDDPTTRVKTKIFSSADISAQVSVSGVAQYVRSLIAGGNLAVSASDLVLLEIVNAGSGTVTIAVNKTGAPNHPTEIPSNQGFTRTLSSTGGATPASLTDSQITYSGTVPYVNFAIANVPVNYQPPSFVKQTSPGTYTVPIPTWMKTGDYIDEVGVGGGGAGGGSLFGTTGQGALGGLWNGRRRIYGIDIPLTTTAITMVVGDHGIGGQPISLGGASATDGAATTFSATGDTAGTLTCGGGIHGGNGPTKATGNSNGAVNGRGTGDYDFEGQHYFGGGDVGVAQEGSAPGGGGSGSLPYAGGYDGAPGMGQVTFTQAT